MVASAAEVRELIERHELFGAGIGRGLTRRTIAARQQVRRQNIG